METLSKKKMVAYGLAASVILNLFLGGYVGVTKYKCVKKFKGREYRIVRMDHGGKGSFLLGMAKRRMSDNGREIVSKQMQDDAVVLKEKFTQLKDLREKLSNVMSAPQFDKSEAEKMMGDIRAKTVEIQVIVQKSTIAVAEKLDADDRAILAATGARSKIDKKNIRRDKGEKRHFKRGDRPGKSDGVRKGNESDRQ